MKIKALSSDKSNRIYGHFNNVHCEQGEDKKNKNTTKNIKTNLKLTAKDQKKGNEQPDTAHNNTQHEK